MEKTFYQEIERYDWEQVGADIYRCTGKDVERALSRQQKTLEDFKALLSPAASPYLEEMAQESHRLTLKRFGNTIRLYAPLYLSNECQNICTYCGFSFTNKIPRKTLTRDELLQEANYLKSQGFEHILIVTGEAERIVGVDYLYDALKLLRPQFAQLSIEVQPLSAEQYRKLCEAGLYGVFVYQETYNEKNYKQHHPRGRKSNYRWRLETPDRLGRAGVHKIGLGILIGLEDWRIDTWFTALHLTYLEKHYWQTQFSISFPRLRPYSGGVVPENIISDRELVQLICAWRLFNEDVDLSLSTRESPHFRDNVIPLGITTMSAGSKTNPGGYTIEAQSLEQFEIDDGRPPAEVAAAIRGKGYDPVWKDWDNVLTGDLYT